MSPRTERNNTDSAEKRVEFDVKGFLDYVRWTLQEQFIDTRTLMTLARKDRERTFEMCWMIANRAVDEALVATRSTTKSTLPKDETGEPIK